MEDHVLIVALEINIMPAVFVLTVQIFVFLVLLGIPVLNVSKLIIGMVIVAHLVLLIVTIVLRLVVLLANQDIISSLQTVKLNALILAQVPITLMDKLVKLVALSVLLAPMVLNVQHVLLVTITTMDSAKLVVIIVHPVSIILNV